MKKSHCYFNKNLKVEKQYKTANEGLLVTNTVMAVVGHAVVEPTRAFTKNKRIPYIIVVITKNKQTSELKQMTGKVTWFCLILVPI